MRKARYLILIILVLGAVPQVAPGYDLIYSFEGFEGADPDGNAAKVGSTVYWRGVTRDNCIVCQICPWPHYCYWEEGSMAWGGVPWEWSYVDDCHDSGTATTTLVAGDNYYDITCATCCGGECETGHNLITIAGVAVGSVTGPETVCAGWGATFNFLSSPAGNEGFICWESTDDDGEAIGCVAFDPDQCEWLSLPDQGMHHSTRTITWYKPGTHTVTFMCGTSSTTKSVRVVSADCEISGCGFGGGFGGNFGGGSGGCGSCGAGGIPAITPRWTQVTAAIPANLLGPAPNGGACSGGLQIIECGGTKIAMYTDECGCYQATLNTCPNPPCTYALGNGITLKQSESDPLTSPYTITDAAGNTIEFDAALETPGVVRTPLLSSITNADENENNTTFTWDAPGSGALESVTVPSGDTWTYGHEPDDTKITSVQAPDGRTTEITYVPSGLAFGEIASIKVYDAPEEPRQLIAQTDYTYYTEGTYKGRLATAVKNDLEVAYEYSENKITVIERSKNQPTQVFSKTEYYYGEDGSDTTTVTRKHPTDSQKDQVTSYQFYTKTVSGHTYKTYLFQVTDPMNNTTKYCRYVSSTTDLTGKTLGTDYLVPEEANDPDLVGKVGCVTDALGRSTFYTYDESTGSLTSVRYLDQDTGPHEDYDYYSGTRWLRFVKNVRGNYTFYERPEGARHQVTAVKVSEAVGDPPGEPNWDNVDAIRSYDYYDSGDQIGLLQKETVEGIDEAEEEDYTKTYGYMNGSRLEPGPTGVTYRYWNGSDYENKTEYMGYNVMGRVTSTTDANNRSIAHTYDKLGRQLTTTYSAGVYTESHYEYCCGLTWTKDEEDHYTHYAYDDANRVTHVWVNSSPTESWEVQGAPLVYYTYDDFGNVETVTTYSDASTGRTTGYGYDKNNRVVHIDHPAPLGDEYFGYDDVGNLEGKKDGDGIITAYEYDDLNRLVKVDYDHGSWPVTTIASADVTYTYQNEGSRLRASMADSTGTSGYEYDIQDRLETYTAPQPSGRDITYTYNNLGQKTSVSTTGPSLTYGYYANGWLKEVKMGTSTIASYAYDEVGNRDGLALGNGASTGYTYDDDPRYRISTVTHTPTVGDPVTISYPSRDGRGNPNSMVDWNGTTPYDYDANSRLTEEDSTVFGYDWVGNRRNPPPDPDGLVFNAADELVVWPGQHTYDYHDTGSLAHEYDSPGTTVLKIHSYTPANLLAEVVHGDDPQTDPKSQMTWDADSNRITFTSSEGGTSQFVYDVTAGIPAVIEEVTPSGSVYYIREPNGGLIARVAGGSTHYYHFDALGSTRLLTDADGAVTDTYTYDAWGQVLEHDGDTPQPYQYVGQLGYYTHVQDNQMNLLQLGVRFYDPETGRFTERDPIADGLNRYVYVKGNPLVLVDPWGLHTVEQCQHLCHTQYLADLSACVADYYACRVWCWRTGPGYWICVYFRCVSRDIICKGRAIRNLHECTRWCEDHPCDTQEQPLHHNPTRPFPDPTRGH